MNRVAFVMLLSASLCFAALPLARAQDSGTLTLTGYTVPTAVPTITSSLSANLTEGQMFAYVVTASNGPQSFTATGLPTGLSIDPVAGVITGSAPTQAGTYTVGLSATNSLGTGATAILTLAVTGTQSGPSLPVEILGPDGSDTPNTSSGQVGVHFTYQIGASNAFPGSYTATGLPAGLSVSAITGLISGVPTVSGTFNVTQGAYNAYAEGENELILVIAPAASYSRPPFFTGEAALTNGVYYLAFPNGNYFGYYAYLADPNYIYHFDLGYEYVTNAHDSLMGVYFYDFKSQIYFYTSPTFPFPYLYNFKLNSVVYYYPNLNNAGHYNTNGIRYFYVFSTGQIVSM